MPKAVEVLSMRSTKSASSSFYVVGKTQVCNFLAINADCPFMLTQCVSHNSLQEYVEEGGESTQPCLTPTVVLNQSPMLLLR